MHDNLSIAPRLRQRMQAAGISSFAELSRRAGVSDWQVRLLRQGKLSRVRIEVAIALAAALELSLEELVQTFSTGSSSLSSGAIPSQDALRQECDRLSQRLASQKDTYSAEFQRASLDILEPWLSFWPVAARAAREREDFDAKKLLPLCHPIEKLLAEWHVTAIAEVGEEVAFEPQLHQPLEASLEVGQRAIVRYPGYKHGDRILFRAKVSPAPPA